MLFLIVVLLLCSLAILFLEEYVEDRDFVSVRTLKQSPSPRRKSVAKPKQLNATAVRLHWSPHKF